MKVNGVKNTECKCDNPAWSGKPREDRKGFIYACGSCGHKWLRGEAYRPEEIRR